MHGEGPVNATLSFMHSGRLHYNSGPGQSLDLSCLQLGRIYEVKAKIKLFDHNGFPFRCFRNAWADPYTCPMFTIALTLSTGETRLVNEWNDIHEVPWYADHFNEFHALFQADEDMVNAVDAYWYFRGPRSDINIALDDVSIMLYDYQLSNAVSIERPPGCGGK